MRASTPERITWSWNTSSAGTWPRSSRRKGRCRSRQAIDYVQQAARGLEFAHKHGVVHRDVKPSNLLLDQEGVVKILDMGLARLNENLAGAPEAMELTGTGQILGTVDYMSPEQAEDVRSADHRSDIYSLGCTLFYLLTRRPVYGGETIVKRILAHRDEPIPSVMEIRPDCPETLDAAIQRMLAKRPEDRPQSMAEIIVELEGCLEKPDAAPPLAGPVARRFRLGAATGWRTGAGRAEPPARKTRRSRKRRLVPRPRKTSAIRSRCKAAQAGRPFAGPSGKRIAPGRRNRRPPRRGRNGLEDRRRGDVRPR